MFLRTGMRMKVVKASLDFRDLNLDTDKVFPKLDARIASVKEINLDPAKYFYFRNRAVSALEYHGPNDNGDAFEEPELIKSHGSFINSRESIDHNGEDVVGMVLDSAWIPFKGIYRVENGVGRIVSSNLLDYQKGDQLIGGWVENIHAMDREVAEERHPGIIQAMLNGEVTDTSMGCYCQSAICSICGNEATTEREYCEHIAHKGRKIAIAGEERSVFERNRGIVFFEDSVILPFHFGGIAGGQGADPRAKSLQVFCSTHPTSLKPYIVNRPLQALASEDYYKVGDKPDAYDDKKEALEEEHKKRVDQVLNRDKDERAEEQVDPEDANEKEKLEQQKKEEASMEPRMWNESELKKFANKEEKPMRRQAGVWSFPNTREKVDKLISSLQDLELDKLYKLTDDDNEDPIIQSLFDLAGDDELWDKLESSDKKGSTIYNMIMDWIEKMYKEYEQDPSNFRSKVDPETMAYVKEFMGRRASKKSPLREAMASLKVLAEGEEIDLEDKKIVDDAVDVFFSLVDDQGMDEKEAVLQVSDVLFGQQVDDFLEALEKLGIDLTPKEMRKKIRELRSAAKQEKPEEKKPEPPKKEDKKEEKTPSEKAFDHILKAILPKKDGGEGKSFAEAQKEAMKLYGEEVKQEKFDQMKKEKDKKKGGDSVDKKKASLEIEAQKARLQEKIGGFFDAKPAGPSKEEKLFDGKPKGSDSPANPFTGKEAPGERGKPQDPFKGKEAPGDRGKPEDHFGEQVPGGDKGGNMYKELTAQVQVLQQKEQDLTKELSLAKMRATSMESRASVYKAKYERAMKAYDLVNEMLSKGMIATASAKKTFQDLVDSNEAQITATENLVKVFQPSAGARIAGLRDRRIAGLSREIQADRSQGAIGAPGAAPVGGDGIEIEDIFNT